MMRISSTSFGGELQINFEGRALPKRLPGDSRWNRQGVGSVCAETEGLFLGLENVKVKS